MKRIAMVVLLMGVTTSVTANGDLADLIIELKHINHMVAQQKKKAGDPDQRMVFRYDLVQQRIDTLIEDIEKHLALVSVQPRIEPVNK